LGTETITKVGKGRRLQAFRPEGFFQLMDALRDRIYLELLWSCGAPPWKCL
jgi:glucose-1-phosphate cytidylyltransferase